MVFLFLQAPFKKSSPSLSLSQTSKPANESQSLVLTSKFSWVYTATTSRASLLQMTTPSEVHCSAPSPVLVRIAVVMSRPAQSKDVESSC
eukprot:5608069-Amphidinium_carterae.2